MHTSATHHSYKKAHDENFTINPNKAGFVLGTLFSIEALILAILSSLFNVGTPIVKILGTLYIGYSPTAIGAVCGIVWGFVLGYATGFLAIFLFHRLPAK